MFEIKEKKVNRKQFHYLLSKFLLEKRLSERFYISSLGYKLYSDAATGAYKDMFEKYNFSDKDTFSEHLYKCIDIYCKEKNPYHDGNFMNTYYNGSIKGFFALTPATFSRDWNFWKRISDEWDLKTRGITYGND